MRLSRVANELGHSLSDVMQCLRDAGLCVQLKTLANIVARYSCDILFTSTNFIREKFVVYHFTRF